MAEKKLIVDQMRLNYDGIFDVSGLYKLLRRLLEKKGYTWDEKRTYERITKQGRDIEIELRPWKSVNTIKIFMTNVKEVELLRDGIRTKLNRGNVKMIFDAFLRSDYEHRWEGNQIYFFGRGIIDQFVKLVYTGRNEAGIVDEIHEIHTAVKAFLNLYRYAHEKISTVPKVSA